MSPIIERRPVGSIKDVILEPNWDDPEFCKLHKRYLEAYRTYLSALRKRREVRAWFHKRKKMPRRPVGSPPNFKIPPAPEQRRAAPVKKRPHRVNMGNILGWITLVESAPPVPTDPDPDAEASYLKMFDRIQLRLYHIAKRRYLDAQRALIDYSFSRHLERARERAQYMTNVQYLGADDEDAMDEQLEKLQAEVLPLCEMALRTYRDDPRPATLRHLLETFVEGQLVNLDEHSVMGEFDSELDKARKAGKLK